ncbi:MAG: asparagine synthase (glutamine-hydrolyzing) [Bacteroidota bacterium]|jgi:asparagine synthase (glutamine-hydrolysing)
MCGITGAYIFNSLKDHQHILDACEVATHDLYLRGPDGVGIYRDEQTAMGHRRLSIIDISHAGAQPFYSKDRRYVLVFNGEIFNFKELTKLYLPNVELRSKSDTEVLLELLIAQGEKAIELLNGFFAFAFYDKETKQMLVARDRYGVKPLYVSINEHAFCFASSLSAVMRYNNKKEICMNALHLYLHLNYIPSPHSIYKGVEKLMPGHYIRIDHQKIEKHSYYILNNGEHESLHTYDQAKNRLHELMTDAVSKRLISDVPLGCFLSGGVDSSVVSAIAARQIPQLHTFSLGFSDNSFFDETKFAEAVAKHIGAHHTTFRVSTEEMYGQLFPFLDTLDEPFADSSALAVYMLSKFTRKHVTVSLSGDGADELFAGYNKHSALLSSMHPGIKEHVVKLAGGLLGHAPKSRHSKIGNLMRKAHKYSVGLKLSDAERYWRWAGFYNQNQLAEMLTHPIPDHEMDAIKARYLSVFHGDIDFNKVLQADFGLVLQGDMLVKVDSMSMANSLEVRTPFLDYRVVDFVFSLPHHCKIDSTRRKKLLIDTFSSYLPNEIFSRPKKGFEIPLHNWFQKHLKTLIKDELLNDTFIQEQGIFNPIEIRKLLQQVFSPSPDDATAKVWALIVFQHWWINKHNRK